MKTTRTTKATEKKTMAQRVDAVDAAWGAYIKALREGREDAAELKRIWQEME